MEVFHQTSTSSPGNVSVRKYLRNSLDFSIEIMFHRHLPAVVLWWKVRRQQSGTGKIRSKDLWTSTCWNSRMESRTYIYTHLPTNFRMDTMLAGSCNLCDDFDELCSFIQEVSSMCPGLNASSLIKDVRVYQKFLKPSFQNLHKGIYPVLNCACHIHLMPAQKTTKQCVQIFHPSVLCTALY